MKNIFWKLSNFLYSTVNAISPYVQLLHLVFLSRYFRVRNVFYGISSSSCVHAEHKQNCILYHTIEISFSLSVSRIPTHLHMHIHCSINYYWFISLSFWDEKISLYRITIVDDVVFMYIWPFISAYILHTHSFTLKFGRKEESQNRRFNLFCSFFFPSVSVNWNWGTVAFNGGKTWVSNTEWLLEYSN